MVSISNWATLALIGGGILAFYKLGGAGGIGSRIGGGFSNLFDSFSSSLNLNSLLPNASAAQVDPYQTWLDTYGTGDGILDVEKKGDKFCVGGFCFNEDPNLAATPPSPIAVPDEATTVNTGGFIQRSSGLTNQQPTSWDTTSFEGVNITGSYTSQAIPNYSAASAGHSQNSNSGGSSGSNSGGSSGGNSGGSGSGGGSGGSTGGSSSGGNSGGSSGGSTGGSSGTSSRGGQGAGRSSNRGR